MDYKELIEELRMVASWDGICYDCNQCVKAVTAIETLMAELDEALRAQHPTAKLDRSRWQDCDWCSQRYCGNCFWQIKMKDSSRCKHCSNKSEWAPIVSYCSNCGRPLTEEAWAALEGRINGGTTDN